MCCEENECEKLPEMCKQGWMTQKGVRRKAERLEQHRAWAEKLSDSAEGFAGICCITALKQDRDEEERKSLKMSAGDAQPLTRVAVVGTSEQVMEDTLRKTEPCAGPGGIASADESEGTHESSNQLQGASTGVGADGCHPKSATGSHHDNACS